MKGEINMLEFETDEKVGDYLDARLREGNRLFVTYENGVKQVYRV